MADFNKVIVVAISLLLVGCEGTGIMESPRCKLSLREFLAAERENRFCSVKKHEGSLVDWTIPGLKIVFTGEFYESDFFDRDINVFTDCGCDCVPEIGDGPHRVRGRISSLSPYSIVISNATID